MVFGGEFLDQEDMSVVLGEFSDGRIMICGLASFGAETSTSTNYSCQLIKIYERNGHAGATYDNF